MPDADVKVWSRAKLRFLDSVAVYWLFSNKVFEIVLFIAVAIFIWQANWIRYLAGVVILYVGAQIFYRVGLYDGFYDGYEAGFSDVIGKTISDIEREERSLTDEERQARRAYREEGFKKLLGVILTWRRIK